MLTFKRERLCLRRRSDRKPQSDGQRFRHRRSDSLAETRLISIHQVHFMPLVEMMITELSTPLASNKCRPLPVVGWRLWMTDFSSDPLLEAKAVISFCCGMVQASQCREVPPCFFSLLLLICEGNISVSVLLLCRMALEGQFKFET